MTESSRITPFSAPRFEMGMKEADRHQTCSEAAKKPQVAKTLYVSLPTRRLPLVQSLLK